ncbi:hypothetical protein NQ315_016006 [Exocentrus adspersus]|uniref:Major facilitator superfamily (MFS) profile domain-containing protein n=1 Tax=Exocentrus adspersus TaxID=1586481 RepID=A0AAV8VKZ8_9CUCU|nr:hypothetical protein NQ315_016006 [Exocentrus adspersus]
MLYFTGVDYYIVATSAVDTQQSRRIVALITANINVIDVGNSLDCYHCNITVLSSEYDETHPCQSKETLQKCQDPAVCLTGIYTYDYPSQPHTTTTMKTCYPNMAGRECEIFLQNIRNINNPVTANIDFRETCVTCTEDGCNQGPHETSTHPLPSSTTDKKAAVYLHACSFIGLVLLNTRWMVFKPLHCIYGKWVIPQRYVVMIMLNLALLNSYQLRVVMNIAMTEIVKPENDTLASYEDACPMYKFEQVDIKGGTYDWPSWIEAFILYAFYIGYFFTHLPAGWLADKIGARHVMGACMLASIILTLVVPVSITHGEYTAAIVLRAVLGIAQGPVYPVTASFLQSWAPATERDMIAGVVYAGGHMGAFTGNLFSEEKVKFAVPWLKIATSVPVWAAVASAFCHNYIYFTMVTDLPKYLKDILKFNVQSNAIFTAVPFLLLWLSVLFFSWLSKLIMNRGWCSMVLQRKIFSIAGILIPSMISLAAVYVGCSREGAITLYTISVMLNAPFYPGTMVNVNDLSRHYSGILMAWVNGLGGLAGILAPWVVGHVTPNALADGVLDIVRDKRR